MRWLGWWSALLLFVSIAGPALAEEADPRTIRKGRYSLAFSLPDGGGSTLGIWKMVSARSNLGMTLGVNHEFEKSTEGPDSMRTEFGSGYWAISLGPSLKRYLVTRRNVSPFLQATFRAAYRWSKVSFTPSGTLEGGIGAEWSPLESISIGGATGFSWTESMTRYSGPGAPKHSDSLFNTMSTSLLLHLYF